MLLGFFWFYFCLCSRAVTCLCIGQVLFYHTLRDFQKVATSPLQLLVGITLSVLAFSLNPTFNLTLQYGCISLISIFISHQMCVYNLVIPSPAPPKCFSNSYLNLLSAKLWGFYWYFKNVFRCTWAGVLYLIVEKLTALWNILLKQKCKNVIAVLHRFVFLWHMQSMDISFQWILHFKGYFISKISHFLIWDHQHIFTLIILLPFLIFLVGHTYAYSGHN